MDRHNWNLRYGAKDLLWSAEPNRFLVQEIEDVEPGKALVPGCGEGRNAIWLATRGWSVVGVDFSDVALERARRLAASRGVTVDWALEDLLEYEPEERAFDLVAILYLHLPPPQFEIVLTRAVDAVASGGTLLLVGHDVRNLTEGYGGPKDPKLLWDSSALVALLKGLEVVKAERVTRPVKTDEGEAAAIDTLVRARRP